MSETLKTITWTYNYLVADQPIRLIFVLASCPVVSVVQMPFPHYLSTKVYEWYQQTVRKLGESLQWTSIPRRIGGGNSTPCCFMALEKSELLVRARCVVGLWSMCNLTC